MAVWKFMRPILNITGATKKLQKRFENLVGENRAAGLSANSAYNAAKREVMEILKKTKVTKTTKEDKKRVLEALRKEKITKKAQGGRIGYGAGDFVKKLKKGKEGRKEDIGKWLKDKGVDLTAEEWRSKPFKEKLKLWAWKFQPFYPGKLEKGKDYASGGRVGFKEGTKKAEGGEIVFGKNVDKDLL